MAYKVIDIYKELPRTNCGDCGRASCFAFASAVYLEAFPLRGCPQLAGERLLAMEAKLELGREKGEGRRPASSEQALRALLAGLTDADLAALADNGGGVHVAGPQEGVRVPLLDGLYLITREDVVAVRGEPPTVWVKVFLLIYLTRASGRLEAGVWVSYRDLPSSLSKAASFEECAAGIAEAFAGDVLGLDRAVQALGGEPSRAASADRVYRLQALPRVGVLLLFWDEEDEFSARASLLVDRNVLDYVDQEALVFLAEALEHRLRGRDLGDLVG
jgi:Domain of unknown function (DUF3786)/Putative Fe-S cluster